jgi:hypothetical protein
MLSFYIEKGELIYLCEIQYVITNIDFKFLKSTMQINKIVVLQIYRLKCLKSDSYPN